MPEPDDWDRCDRGVGHAYLPMTAIRLSYRNEANKRHSRHGHLVWMHLTGSELGILGSLQWQNDSDSEATSPAPKRSNGQRNASWYCNSGTNSPSLNMEQVMMMNLQDRGIEA